MTASKDICILFAEDDDCLLFLAQEQLEEKGFTVIPVGNGLDAYRMFLESKPDIIILDIDMPGIDGIKLCRQIRKMDRETPIIFTTGLARTDDVKTGFEAGANDYLKKPYDVDELVVRVQHLTKTIRITPSEQSFNLGSFTFFCDAHILSHADGISYSLSYTENSLLKLLCQHIGEIVTRDEIIEAVWGDKPIIDSRSIDVYISKLRKYLSHDPAKVNIINCYGRGYRLTIG